MSVRFTVLVLHLITHDKGIVEMSEFFSYHVRYGSNLDLHRITYTVFWSNILLFLTSCFSLCSVPLQLKCTHPSVLLCLLIILSYQLEMNLRNVSHVSWSISIRLKLLSETESSMHDWNCCASILIWCMCFSLFLSMLSVACHCDSKFWSGCLFFQMYALRVTSFTHNCFL